MVGCSPTWPTSLAWVPPSWILNSAPDWLKINSAILDLKNNRKYRSLRVGHLEFQFHSWFGWLAYNCHGEKQNKNPSWISRCVMFLTTSVPLLSAKRLSITASACISTEEMTSFFFATKKKKKNRKKTVTIAYDDNTACFRRPQTLWRRWDISLLLSQRRN